MNQRIIELIAKIDSHKKKKGRSFDDYKTELNELVCAELIKSDSVFKSQILENKKALINNNLTIQVYQEGRSPIGTHATKLIGNIRRNGFVYLEADKIETFLDPFAKKMYPVKLSGKIEWNGRIRLYVNKTKFKLFGSRIPKTFKGSINQNGGITAELTKSEFELYGEGFMNQMILDPFNGNEEIRSRFIENTIQLNQQIKRFIEKIKESQ